MANSALQSLTIHDQTDAFGKAIGAIALRYLVVSRPVISAYANLMREHPSDEPRIHAFLEAHPLLLDPLGVRTWSKPDLHGKWRPDFLLQRADGSYSVVEIETPAKALITDKLQLTAPATQAVTQALMYRDFLASHFESASRTFPNFRLPDALVVIGNEQGLSSPQAEALRRENEGRSYLKIVGSDYLATRALTMLGNLTGTRRPAEEIRME